MNTERITFLVEKAQTKALSARSIKSLFCVSENQGEFFNGNALYSLGRVRARVRRHDYKVGNGWDKQSGNGYNTGRLVGERAIGEHAPNSLVCGMFFQTKTG